MKDYAGRVQVPDIATDTAFSETTWVSFSKRPNPLIPCFECGQFGWVPTNTTSVWKQLCSTCKGEGWVRS